MIFVYIPVLVERLPLVLRRPQHRHPTDFVGPDTYAYLLQDRAFLTSMGPFVVFAAFIVPLTFVCSLGLALMVNRVRVAKAFFRSSFFLPTACSYVIAAMIWSASYFLSALTGSAVERAATKASCGTSTRPTIFIRFLPSFCFSSSLRLRVMSPP